MAIYIPNPSHPSSFTMTDYEYEAARSVISTARYFILLHPVRKFRSPADNEQVVTCRRGVPWNCFRSHVKEAQVMKGE
jgi:hypothetical protein